ncbi:MAG TPA: hypothetical protein VFY41_05605 [Nitrososphaeraceae archaeon]|nr:hypothetical protein [Nitrososphaeraceae archaeon]
MNDKTVKYLLSASISVFIVALLGAITIPFQQQQQPVTVPASDDNPVILTETREIEGEVHQILIYEDGTKKMTNLKTDECVYLNEESGTITPCV